MQFPAQFGLRLDLVLDRQGAALGQLQQAVDTALLAEGLALHELAQAPREALRDLVHLAAAFQ